MPSNPAAPRSEILPQSLAQNLPHTFDFSEAQWFVRDKHIQGFIVAPNNTRYQLENSIHNMLGDNMFSFKHLT